MTHDAETVELKPCPFCGGSAADPQFNEDDGRGEVYCVKCTCCIQSEYIGWLHDEPERQTAIQAAIKAWNTRTDIAQAELAALQAENAKLREAADALADSAKQLVAIDADDREVIVRLERFKNLHRSLSAYRNVKGENDGV